MDVTHWPGLASPKDKSVGNPESVVAYREERDEREGAEREEEQNDSDGHEE